VYFLFVIVWLSVPRSAIDCLERLVSEITYYVSRVVLLGPSLLPNQFIDQSIVS